MTSLRRCSVRPRRDPRPRAATRLARACALAAGLSTPALAVAAQPPEPEATAPAPSGQPEASAAPSSPPEATFMVAPNDAITGSFPLRTKPLFSIKDGVFCFVEDAQCWMSLLLWADVGAGINAIETDEAFDVPYTQVRVGGGLTIRPLQSRNGGDWHPWALGISTSYSWGSGSVLPGTDDTPFIERSVTPAFRIGLLNQLWFGPRRNGLHLDATLGLVRSTVFKASSDQRYSGTNVEIGFGFGGWGGVFTNADFLDGDTRIVFGFKGHGIAMAPIAGLVISGLLLGGVSLSGGGS